MICPLTPTNAQVDDNGCEIIEYTTDSDDDGNKLDLSVVGCLGLILGLLGVLVMLVFFRDREREEVEFNGKGFYQLIEKIQTQEMILEVSSQPLYITNPDFKAFIDECVLISSNLNNKKDINTLNLIFERMKQDVYVPLCAVAYLRGAITCFARILRRNLMEYGWDAPVKIPGKEYDRGSGQILWNLCQQQRKDWFKQMPPILKSCIIFPLIKEQAKKTTLWNKLLHPETWKSSDVNAYTSQKLAGELRQSRRFINMVEILERRTLETTDMIPFDQ